MKTTILICFCSLLPLISALDETLEGPTVETTTGTIEGKTVSWRGINVHQFLGIPFVEAPIGKLRFQKPVPKEPWDGVLSTKQWALSCPQYRTNITTFKHLETSEDCLYLNVFVSESTLNGLENGKTKSVLFWIHGGGFGADSASTPGQYDGTAIAALKNLVVVTFNYRLGPLGFLSLPEAGIDGNMGLWDQLAALQWTSENIPFFGGNPKRITLFGQSAGSISISIHLVSPQTKGLFTGAIMQSRVLFGPSMALDPSSSESFLKALNCSEDEVNTCLASYQPGVNKEADSIAFAPLVGDSFLPDLPTNLLTAGGDFGKRKINVLVGTNGFEGAATMATDIDPILFDPVNPKELTLLEVRKILYSKSGPYSLRFLMNTYFSSIDPSNSTLLRLTLAQAIGDILTTCPTYNYAKDLTLSGRFNVYAYYLTQKPLQNVYHYPPPNTIWLPPTHSDDVPFVFGHSLYPNAENRSDEEVLLSTIVIDAWANFARKGKPGFIGPSKWPAWSINENGKVDNPTMELNSNRIGSFDSARVDFCFDNFPFPLKETSDISFEVKVNKSE